MATVTTKAQKTESRNKELASAVKKALEDYPLMVHATTKKKKKKQRRQSPPPPSPPSKPKPKLKPKLTDCGGAMQIFIKTLSDKHLAIDVDRTCTIGKIKQRIMDIQGIPVDQQYLLWAGKNLENDKTLGEYKVQKESTLHIVLRNRGGMFAITSGREDLRKMGVTYKSRKFASVVATRKKEMDEARRQNPNPPQVQLFLNLMDASSFTITSLNSSEQVETILKLWDEGSVEGKKDASKIAYIMFNGEKLDPSRSLSSYRMGPQALLTVIVEY